MPKRNTIPVHRLGEQTDQGYRLEKVNATSKAAREALVMDLHRDDHYIFLVLEKGRSMGLVEFETFAIGASMILCILPGQVHNYYGVEEDTTGWFIAMDPGLIPDGLRAVLEDPLIKKKPLTVEAQGFAELTKCLELAHALQERTGTVYSRQAIYSLLTTFTAMFTGCYACSEALTTGTISRTQGITREFRKLLAKEFKTLKSPGEYAAALHLSLSYLNEAVKETTGFTVSYWIQQEIVLEARRLLYYSACSVKEIAHELGYADHTYFSRMFRKMAGRSPGEFRRLYHK